MQRNMGAIDRMLRLAVSLVIITLYLTGKIQSTAATLLLLVAGVFAVTSLAGFCPLYTLLHINTCNKRKDI